MEWDLEHWAIVIAGFSALISILSFWQTSKKVKRDRINRIKEEVHDLQIEIHRLLLILREYLISKAVGVNSESEPKGKSNVEAISTMLPEGVFNLSYTGNPLMDSLENPNSVQYKYMENIINLSETLVVLLNELRELRKDDYNKRAPAVLSFLKGYIREEDMAYSKLNDLKNHVLRSIAENAE